MAFDFRSEMNVDEMTGTIHLPSSVLNKKIPYKYVVFSPFPNIGSSWEFIHDLSVGGVFNRCLELNQSSSTSKFIIM